MKKLIQLKLKILSKIILNKYKPEVIGITGSIGKTGAKEAVYTVLKRQYSVRRNIKNYNNEIGLPLTIIGAKSPGKNIFGWIRIFLKALNLIFIRDKNYPKILILEMGVDRPRDMDYLNSIVKCDAGILTFIGTVHAEFFGSRKKLLEEKEKLLKNLKKNGLAIVNYDNKEARAAGEKSQKRLLTYGLEQGANLQAKEIKFVFKAEKEKNIIKGLNFKLSYKGSFVPVFLPDVLGRGAIYAALAGAAVGIMKNMNLVEIAGAFEKNSPLPGRMNIISGIKNTIIIDDSYNCEPESAKAAIEALKDIPIESGARRFAVLGDMLELGSYSEAGHREVGRNVARLKIDKLIVVGERARDIARGAEKAGMKKDNIFHFPKSEEAGRFLQERMKENDLILVKGSQGMRMEKIVLEIMAEPLKAKELLVRQGSEWQNK